LSTFSYVGNNFFLLASNIVNFFHLDPEMISLPKIDFSGVIKRPFWQNISKDILSPFAPKEAVFARYINEKSCQ